MEAIEQVIQWIDQYRRLITINDILDIAIIAYLVYQALLLVRRGRMAQVVKAILLLLAALGLAYALGLRTLYFVLRSTVEWGTLALIIVFQPEVRRFLEQLGNSSLGTFFYREESLPEIESCITQTVAAYTSMSKDKVGALMIFERKILLDDVIKTGTVMDASVSAELLKNLFWNKAPLHDGALIVRGGRIVGAGCMLPLSRNTNLSKDIGMRHRAGIGMSENSDAVVAIVSEETGSISVAVGGMLKRHLAPETLERLLRNELLPDQEPGKTSRLSQLFRSKKGEKSHGETDHRT